MAGTIIHTLYSTGHLNQADRQLHLGILSTLFPSGGLERKVLIAKATAQVREHALYEVSTSISVARLVGAELEKLHAGGVLESSGNGFKIADQHREGVRQFLERK